jgi:hypothetical protein
MNKSYNPFKMYGSWIGLIAYLILGYTLVNYNNVFVDIILAPAYPLFTLIMNLFFPDSNSIVIYRTVLYISLIITGFLIGWVIHALIRKFRK